MKVKLFPFSAQELKEEGAQVILNPEPMVMSLGTIMAIDVNPKLVVTAAV